MAQSFRRFITRFTPLLIKRCAKRGDNSRNSTTAWGLCILEGRIQASRAIVSVDCLLYENKSKKNMEVVVSLGRRLTSKRADRQGGKRMLKRIVQAQHENGEIYWPQLFHSENEPPIYNPEVDQTICAPCYEKKCFCLCSQGPTIGYRPQYQQNTIINNIHIYATHEDLFGLVKLSQMNNQNIQVYNINLAASPYYEYAFIRNMGLRKTLSRMRSFVALAEKHSICSGASHSPCAGDCIVFRHNNILKKLLRVLELLIEQNTNIASVVELILHTRITDGHQWTHQQIVFLDVLRDAARELHRQHIQDIELVRLIIDIWDSIVDKVNACCPLTSNRSYKVFREGFFTPNNQNLYPSGCYVRATENQIRTVTPANIAINIGNFPPELRTTIIHEMTHAYMAMTRTQSSIYVCPWIEEGYATLFEHRYAGINGPFLYTGCDGEAYAAAEMISKMYIYNRQDFWDLLSDYLKPQLPLTPGYFCIRHQDHQTHNWIEKLRS